MRKSLGNKRNEIGVGGNGTQTTSLRSPVSTVPSRRASTSGFSTIEDFGYRRVTVERPLRLNFAVNDERLEEVQIAAHLRSRHEQEARGRSGAEAEIAEGEKLQKKIITALLNLRVSGRLPTGRSSPPWSGTPVNAEG